MIEVKEIPRLWLAGHSPREVSRLATVDRKTVRPYVEAAQACGVDHAEGSEQLTDELLGAVIDVVRPERPRGTGPASKALAALTATEPTPRGSIVRD